MAHIVNEDYSEDLRFSLEDETRTVDKMFETFVKSSMNRDYFWDCEQLVEVNIRVPYTMIQAIVAFISGTMTNAYYTEDGEPVAGALRPLTPNETKALSEQVVATLAMFGLDDCSMRLITNEALKNAENNRALIEAQEARDAGKLV